MASPRLRVLIIGLTALSAMFAIVAWRRSAEPVNKVAIAQQQHRTLDPYNMSAVDSAVRLLRTGDLVLRTGADITSYMFTQLNQTDKTYSHCGLVIVENGYPFVYHSIGGEDNPDQRIRRDSATFWFSPANNLGFGIARFCFDTVALVSLTRTVHRFYREKRMFDMKFDLSTDNRLYCAEFAYKALNQALRDSSFIRPVHIFGYTFVGVDNLFCNSHARLVCQVRYK